MKIWGQVNPDSVNAKFGWHNFFLESKSSVDQGVGVFESTDSFLLMFCLVVVITIQM